jgi:hypothetical protein
MELAFEDMVSSRPKYRTRPVLKVYNAKGVFLSSLRWHYKIIGAPKK